MNNESDTQSRIGDNLAWLSLFVAVVSALLVLARTLYVAGCADNCSYQILEAATRGFWMTDLIVFLVTIGAFYVARPRLRLAWIFPTIGISITLIAFIIANLLMNGAFDVG